MNSMEENLDSVILELIKGSLSLVLRTKWKLSTGPNKDVNVHLTSFKFVLKATTLYRVLLRL